MQDDGDIEMGTPLMNDEGGSDVENEEGFPDPPLLRRMGTSLVRRREMEELNIRQIQEEAIK
jgi:hypothetical protein